MSVLVVMIEAPFILKFFILILLESIKDWLALRAGTKELRFNQLMLNNILYISSILMEYELFWFTNPFF